MRIVDLFCGIGGVAEAVRPQVDQHHAGEISRGMTAAAEVVAAIDIDRTAIEVYAANHWLTPTCATLESIRQIPEADLWWLSPPCQPYTSRGAGRAEHDRRSQALQHLIGLIGRQHPAMVVLENVPAFAGSAHHRWLTKILREAGYSVSDQTLCPRQWGVPMRRNRFYLLARRDGLPIPAVATGRPRRTIASYVDPSAWSDPTLYVSEALCQRFGEAMNVLDAADGDAVAACFTSAYGRSPVRAGSYLRHASEPIVRRFSVGEIARLMGFRDDFVWPPRMDQRTRYRLLGNSLSVTVVRVLLESFTRNGFGSGPRSGEQSIAGNRG